MRRVFADIETDGLLDELTKVHCLVLRDLDTGQVLSCTDSAPDNVQERKWYESIQNGLILLQEADEVWFHNGTGFDIPALKKVYPDFKLRGTLRDSLVIVRFRWAHIKDSDYSREGFPKQLAGSHSLEAWGHRLKAFKGNYDGGWAEWSEAMQTYCEQDTATGASIVRMIEKHRDSIPPEAVETEHVLAEYLFRQEMNGWPFDVGKAVKLQGVLSEKREAVVRELVAMVPPRYKKNGQPVTPKRDNKKTGATAGSAYTKVKLVEFNPGSRPDIIHRLRTAHGWVPTEFTPSGEAKLDDDVLAGFKEGIPEVAKIREFLLIEKRLGQLAEGREAWLTHQTTKTPAAKQTGMAHIHHRVKPNFAITHRASHVKPNLGQVVSVTAPYGSECRELFTVPKGWVQVGADASGLELRCLGHYMAKHDGGKYIAVILHGDPHATNRDALGLEGKSGRSAAKTFIYAFLYGEGDEQRGKNLLALGIIPFGRKHQEPLSDYHKRVGRHFKKRFLKGLPALKQLLDDVALKPKKGKDGKPLFDNEGKPIMEPREFVLTPDRRRTYIRHQHAALNSLLQSCGAIICKRWIVEFDRRLRQEFGEQGWGGKWAALGWIHDEVQLAVRPEIAERVCEILVDSIRHMTQHFNFRCPLDGEAKIGGNWKETH